MIAINVIIPVVMEDLCNELIESIEVNTILPSKIIIIDNTANRNYRPISGKFKIDVYHSLSGKVNESWNLGVSFVDVLADFVSILNDDIYVNKWFFQRIVETFKSYNNCGVACPAFVNSMEMFGSGKSARNIVKMRRREGFAFTVKKTCLDAIPPIPANRIEIFHGDDWYWYWIHKNGNFWYKDLGNIIFHHVGSSILLKGYRRLKKNELNEWNEIKKELHA